nr:hypothetical protein [Nannocystis sp.]
MALSTAMPAATSAGSVAGANRPGRLMRENSGTLMAAICSVNQAKRPAASG